ncbi:MAG: SDR family NAD(P)-dependent oxidoreductase [Hyphomicrobiaceae bacterium]|nr:SDR family NAD(P)-dependent oxidoreductase [Hyphomicrobiaceae bacterium]
MLRLDGKVAFVSGAGSVGEGWGNGKATAVLLARQGARVYGTDIREEAVAETRALVAAEGGTCEVAACDMTDADAVAACVEDCRAKFGCIDILVNNVGGSAPGTAASMSEQVWDTQMAHNLKTMFLAAKHVLPLMEAQGSGVVINLSSIAGLRMSAERPHVAYSTAKLGILGFTRSTAMAYAKKGIRCNTVIPGLMHTPLVEHRLAKSIAGGDVAALIARRDAAVPMGHMGTAWDVAHAILFLVSDEARYITGAELLVDGGLSAAGMA